MNKSQGLWVAVAVGFSIGGAPMVVHADAVEDFYRGKALKLIIRAGPGGNYDTYSRLLGRHMVRYIPGAPNALPVNMPGGGGLTALNYVANVAPHDGTILTMITQSLPMEQALGLNKRLKVDIRGLNWIGNMSNANMFMFTAPQSKTRTFEDATKRRTIIAATGIASISTYIAAVSNNLLGTKFKVIYGYPSGPEMNLAMARGEAEGRTSSNPEGMTMGGEPVKFNFILQAGLEKDEAFPNTPLFKDLGKDEDAKLVLDFLSKVISLSRPVATNSGVPAERVAALRTAFAAAMKDPEFKKDAEKVGVPVRFTDGEKLQQIVTSILDTPKPTLDQVRQAIQFKAGDTERGKGQSKKKKKSN